MRSRSQLPFYLAAAVGGAAFMYFADSQHGRRRRHVTRDKAVSLSRHAGRRGRKLVHHVTSDARGYVERARHARARGGEELDDQTLVDKVESIVFRDRDVPKGQINVNAENGVVFLRGQVDRPELVDALEARVRKVSGVRDVQNLLRTP
jgi:osmotically-inducible protein OsmY